MVDGFRLTVEEECSLRAFIAVAGTGGWTMCTRSRPCHLLFVKSQMRHVHGFPGSHRLGITQTDCFGQPEGSQGSLPQIVRPHGSNLTGTERSKPVCVNCSALRIREGEGIADWGFRIRPRASERDILPTGYIYPREDRPVRDLLRRRSLVVRQRTPDHPESAEHGHASDGSEPRLARGSPA